MKTLLKEKIWPNWKGDMTVLKVDEKAKDALQEIRVGSADWIEVPYTKIVQDFGKVWLPKYTWDTKLQVNRVGEP